MMDLIKARSALNNITKNGTKISKSIAEQHLKKFEKFNFFKRAIINFISWTGLFAPTYSSYYPDRTYFKFIPTV